MSARLAAAALALALCASPAAAQQDHSAADAHAYVAPSPGDLGGAISLRDAAGASFTNENLRGGWTMLYFGYARCRSACPVAVPTLAAAVDGLRARCLGARGLHRYRGRARANPAARGGGP